MNASVHYSSKLNKIDPWARVKLFHCQIIDLLRKMRQELRSGWRLNPSQDHGMIWTWINSRFALGCCINFMETQSGFSNMLISLKGLLVNLERGYT